ncbi:MAG TPA: SDR family NAD(P)-dependent oxidoreductase, partial [Polyangia bacterium]
MARKLEDSVVVITGASSGIGRATALAFAQEHAAVVLAARREGPLRDAAAACDAAGGRALAVPTEVADETSMQRLAQAAVGTFGRIDVWINNAGVGLFGKIEEVPMDAVRRVIDINLLGYVLGARVAIPIFKAQGGGVLINNASILGRLTQPFTSAYVASKHAVLGLTEALRLELRDTDIQVCAVLPAAIDTPFYQHGANYTG